MNAWWLGGLVYRELIVQAITQSRRTGARPVKVDRIVNGYGGVIKAVASIMTTTYLAAPLIIDLITHWNGAASMYQSPPYEYLAMYFIILMIYMLLTPPIVTSVMGYPVIGDLLRVLGLNEAS